MPDKIGEGAETIEELKAALREANAWRDSVIQAFDRLSSGIVMYGPDDVLVFCNRRFREIYPEIGDLLLPGTPYHAIARAFYQRHYHKSTTLTEDEYVQQRVTQHLAPDECDNEYQLNPESWVMSSDRKTADGGVIGFRLDISERKRVEAKLAEAERMAAVELERKVRERTEDLINSNAQLESALFDLRSAQQQLVQSEKLASLGFLVVGVAHEINTPIGNSLLMGSDMRDEAERFTSLVQNGLTRRQLDAHVNYQNQASAILVANLQRAAKLVQGFKQLAVDRATEHRREFSLREVVEEVALAMSPMLRKYKLDYEVPDTLQMDSYPGPLNQILVNFINNALIHAFEGRESGRMSITARSIDDDTLELVFSDDGCGMDAHVAGKVFDPFFTTRLGQGGNGLGMHIAYNIATQLLGGSIAVDSAPDHGTRWILCLPIAAP